MGLDATLSAGSGASVSKGDAQHELERIVSDPAFRCTDRNRKFLRFIVEETLRGRGDAIKAYTIAVDVFGRPASFDPATDPIVRIEATRLRAALASYYDGHASNVRIDLSRGRYVPVFTHVEDGPPATGGPVPGVAEPTVASATDDALSPASPKSRLFPGARLRWAAVAIGLAAGLALGSLSLVGSLGQPSAREFSERPSVRVALLAQDASDAETLRLRDLLIMALSRFQTLRVFADDLPEDGSARPGGPPPPAYEIALDDRPDASNHSVLWRLTDSATGEILRVENERISNGTSLDGDRTETLALLLASRLAGGRGLFSSIETERELRHPTLGNGCLIRATLALASATAVALADARSCLAETIDARPGDSNAHAMLSAVLLRLDRPDRPTELSEDALRQAQLSRALAPDSSLAATAEMATLFRAGQPGAAVLAGREAVRLNPASPGAAATLATILALTGQRSEPATGVEAEWRQSPAVEFELPLALEAFGQARYDEAAMRLGRTTTDGDFLAGTLLAATRGQLNLTDEGMAAVAAHRRSYPGFEKHFRATMARWQVEPRLAAAIEAGLARAGAAIP